MAHVRTTNQDPRQGTMFSEIVTLPTLAPALARPYHTPGTPEHLAAQAAREREAAAQAVPSQTGTYCF